MALLVDSSVWSLALRRDRPTATPEARHLTESIRAHRFIASTGVILQEILQGAVAQATRAAIAERFGAVRMLVPTTGDHIAAADLSNTWHRRGVQLATIDALIARLSIAHDAVLLTTDADFRQAARHIPLQLWSP